MRRVLQLLSILALCLTVFPSVLFFTGQLELGTMKWLMLAATIAWFLATPLWMGRKRPEQSSE